MEYTFFAGEGGAAAPCVYYIDMAEYPFDLSAAVQGLRVNVVDIKFADWNDVLTPWAAPGLYRGDDDFGGGAEATRLLLCNELVPDAEHRFGIVSAVRGVCGYSLGGLFAAYSFAADRTFNAMASLSGSFWYPEWVDYVAHLSIDGAGRSAFFSLGAAERHANPPILHTVESCTERTQEILAAAGVATAFSRGLGGHFDYVSERIAEGMAALDDCLVPCS